MKASRLSWVVVLIGKNEQRMKRAESLGAHRTFDAQSADVAEILELSGGRGFDVVVIATNNPAAADLAFKIATRGSRVSLFARNDSAKLDYNFLHYNQISVIGSFSSVPDNFREGARIAGERKIVDLSKMVTHRFLLEQIHKAFSATANYGGMCVAVSSD